MRVLLKQNPEMQRLRRIEHVEKWRRKMRSTGRCYGCGIDANGRFRCERCREELNARRRKKPKTPAFCSACRRRKRFPSLRRTILGSSANNSGQPFC
jgi:hypothetical protein